MDFHLEEALTDVLDRHRHPQPTDPLHTRAREAIARLGLDGSRLETAVAVFGWGSDEANGSLLGLARSSNAWGYFGVRSVYDGDMREWHVIINAAFEWASLASEGETDALVDALESVPR